MVSNELRPRLSRLCAFDSVLNWLIPSGDEGETERVGAFDMPYSSIKRPIRTLNGRARSAALHKFFRIFGVPYGSRTRVAAVKEKGPIVIQRNLAAWIALYRI